MKIRPLTAKDFYKANHRPQYPAGTTEVYSNLTARSNSRAIFLDDVNGGKKIVMFGLQYFIKHFLQAVWVEGFFNQSKEDVVSYYKRRMDTSLGAGAVAVEHLEALHDLGYLPLIIKALPEGARVPYRVPVITIANTHPEFFWLTNMIETVMSSYTWRSLTSATTAFEYKRLLTQFALKTGSSLDFVPFQAHDFSMRGLSYQDSVMSGAGHLTSFQGTDTIPAIDFCEDYYGADAEEELIGGSVNATEHSVMCMGMPEGEINTVRRLMTEVHPTGILSVVADTDDFFQFITQYMVELKDDILARDGKLVVRPDSGDPVKIICGDPNASLGTPEHKGAMQCLWEIYGGTATAKEYRLLDPHIGLIYGDSITLTRAEMILTQLKAMGFASANIVFGIGSFTYQYVTRDTHGLAIKATSGVVNGERREIFKDPKTDNGIKKSAKGLLRVALENGDYVLYDQQTEAQEKEGELKTVFLNGDLKVDHTLGEIRARLTIELNQILETDFAAMF